MRDTTHLPGPEGPAHTAPAGPPAGHRSGEGSQSVLEQMLKDTPRKRDAGASAQRPPQRTHGNGQTAR